MGGPLLVDGAAEDAVCGVRSLAPVTYTPTLTCIYISFILNLP